MTGREKKIDQMGENFCYKYNKEYSKNIKNFYRVVRKRSPKKWTKTMKKQLTEKN